MITKAADATTDWEPLDGFERLAECQKSGQEITLTAVQAVKNAGGKLLGEVRPDGRSAVFQLTESGEAQTVETRYLCFPGSFDPRLNRP